jgi:hypothetical protein
MLTLNGASDVLQRLVGMKTSGNETVQVYLALSKTAGGITGEGILEPNEVESPSYKRALIGRKGQNQTTLAMFSEPKVAGDGVSVYIENIEEIHFNEVQENWGSLGYFALYNQAEGGTPTYVGQLKEVITPTVNTVPIARKGNIKITLSPDNE